jgi:predicted nucleotidyltransferase
MPFSFFICLLRNCSKLIQRGREFQTVDIAEIKIKAIGLRNLLRDQAKIHADLILLFGSYARNQAHADSDIDIAVVSRDFGKDRFKEGSVLTYWASQLDPRIEAVPVALSDYLSSEPPVSPLLFQIMKEGTPLL